MQFVKPMPFKEAVDKLGSKSVIGSKLKSSEWSEVPVALRERAFFSSQVESIRVLQRGRDAIADWQQQAREVLPDGQTALKTGSRAQFVDLMQGFLEREGIERGDGGLTDITSEKRLGLIFDTQTRQANDYGYWRQGLDPDVLDEFPAQRFIRVQEVSTPRPVHQQNENVVRLKSDISFWTAMNSPAFGGFGTPHGPWGFNSGMDVEDVDRDEAERLGLIAPNQKVAPPEIPSLTAGAAASTKTLDPDLLAKLLQAFGPQVQYDPVKQSIQWAKKALAQ